MPKKRATKRATKRIAKSPAKKRAEATVRDTAESQQAAAARLGCPPEHVKLAKSLGCLAFKPGSRISISVLRDYMASDDFKAALDDHEKNAGENWTERLKRAKAKREEHRLAVDRGKVWDAEVARRLFAAGDTAMSETLRRAIESEFPPLVEGKSAAEILKIGRKFLDDLLAELNEARVRAAEEMAADMAEDEGDEE